jgi:hypothetical protein
MTGEEYDLFTNSDRFRFIVKLLRDLDPQYRTLALHAAFFWPDERIEPERACELTKQKPEVTPAWLRLVPKAH